ncbi:MAG TPA: Ig-like domain-containing protein [Verrucomicrobiae bacterium]|nr:Ig-like domain-containing protein [Verrucomicrobiae bacterium]
MKQVIASLAMAAVSRGVSLTQPENNMKMKKNSSIPSLACVAALALAAVTTHGQNVLTNPGFETDAVLNAAPMYFATDWTLFGPFAGTASANTDITRSGIGSLKLIANGGFSVPGAYQTLPAVAGQLWDLQGYMWTSNSLPAGNTFGLLKIVWSDGVNDLAPGTVTIGTANFANPGIESTPLLNSSSTPNAWHFTRAQGIAPAGTTQVKLFALNVDASAATVFADDLQATNSGSTPLTVSITSPANQALVSDSFTIKATASVLPGAVTNVYFYVDNVLVGNVETAPYSFDVTGASLGSHTLKVVAKADTGGSVTSAVVNVTSATSATVYVDPSKNWVGYMNWFATPQDGGGYEGGSVWATVDLKASFSGSVLTLSPNSIDDSNTVWYVTTNSPSVANRSMEANMYVEPVGSLPGKTVTFTGTCISDTLTSPSNVNPAGNGWTCVAVVKDLAPDYSSSVIASVPVTNGMPFSVSLATINDPARHVQYGFVTTGPCVWPQDPVLPSYGKVQIATSTATAVSITPSLSGSTLNLSFPTQTGFAYTVQYKTNLTDVSWNTLTVTNGTGSTAVVTNSANSAKRFYRLSIQ